MDVQAFFVRNICALIKLQTYCLRLLDSCQDRLLHDVTDYLQHLVNDSMRSVVCVLANLKRMHVKTI